MTRYISFSFFFNDTATTEIYTTEDTLSLHDALPISPPTPNELMRLSPSVCSRGIRSEEHTSELQSPSVISYAVFCLKKKKNTQIKPKPRSNKTTELLAVLATKR